MAKVPSLSVIIITHNNGANLPRTIESLREQTYQDFELLIVDDGSTDGTWELIDQMTWQRLRAHRNETPRGEAAAINQALEWAEGEFIALHRSGDVSNPKRFAKQIERMRRGRTLGAIGSYVDWVDEAGRLLRRWEPPTGHKAILLQLEQEGEALTLQGVPVMVVQGSMMFRFDALEEVGGLREELGLAAVMDLWRRLGETYKLANIKEVLYTATFNPDDPMFGEYFEGRIYAALALQLAEERAQHQQEQTNFEEAVKTITTGREERLRGIARRVERASNYMRWAETFENWGDGASEHVREMWLRAVAAWPFNPEVWRFAARQLFGREREEQQK
ncbi:MAG TPA: glycosyltransferase family 2 protein [Aggregatilineales bacterium]|nr:glycosyltransferase family 2 protein [Aggregatilineales bacterium]HPV05441.1 glycosyltransferase family 2 protein [Aggregatilineales bacterium]HQA67015.1 glycosyltransferase family 2 protein [Aggregatilineales bacterium]HQE17141.1 glycosyltransferase family 2 protein [Aggregatilineales bacterium]